MIYLSSNAATTQFFLHPRPYYTYNACLFPQRFIKTLYGLKQAALTNNNGDSGKHLNGVANTTNTNDWDSFT